MKKTLILFVLTLVLLSNSACTNQSVSSSKAQDATTEEGAATTETGAITTETGATNATNGTTQNLSVTSPTKGEAYNTGLNWNVLRGTAPQGTVSVEVNGYKLAKYIPGSTTWNYIAATRMQTLKEGENAYTIKALDAEGNLLQKLEYVIHYQNGYALPNVGTGLPLLVLLSFVTAGAIFFRRRLV